MTLVKGIALSLLSFLLFLSLTIFGFAYMVNGTVLNPNFLNRELDRIDFSALIQDIISEEFTAGEDFPEELTTALNDAIPGLEEVIKERVQATIDHSYNYLLGKREKPNLKATLGDTFLNAEFVDSLLETLDLSLLLEQLLSNLDDEGGFPEDFTIALTDTIDDLETELKQRVASSTDPVFKYMLGETDNINLTQILRSNVLAADFVTTLIDKLSQTTMVTDFINEVVAPEVSDAKLDDVIDRLLPEVISQISDSIDPILDYLLGQSDNLDLSVSVTLSAQDLVDVITQQLPELTSGEVEPYIRELLIEQITGVVPAEVTHLVDSAITDQWLSEQINTANTLVLNYLTGESYGLTIEIALQPVLNNLKTSLKEEFMANLPAELTGMPQATIDQYYDTYFQEIADTIPASIIIDENLLGTDLLELKDRFTKELEDAVGTEGMTLSFDIGDSFKGIIPVSAITNQLQEAEESLASVRQDLDKELGKVEDVLEDIQKYVGQFQTYYYILIAIAVLLILGIILINRQVKASSRQLGIIFLLYGIIDYVGIMLGKGFAGTAISNELGKADLPQTLTDLPMQIVNDFISPLQTFSLIVLIVGMVLVILSFVYPRLRGSSSDDELPA